MNAAAFLVMLADKNRAKKKLWRVPEAVLFILALLGGSLGIWAGMYLGRHKTRHLKFVVGIPLILIMQIVLLYLTK
jgi:uncharacterized membrane protein YsdA (DUF1294 family)